MAAAARSRSWAPSCSTSHSSAWQRAPPSCSCPGTCWGRAMRRSSAWWPTWCSTVYDERDTLLLIEIVLSFPDVDTSAETHKKLREKIKYTLSQRHKSTTSHNAAFLVVLTILLAVEYWRAVAAYFRSCDVKWCSQCEPNRNDDGDSNDRTKRRWWRWWERVMTRLTGHVTRHTWQQHQHWHQYSSAANTTQSTTVSRHHRHRTFAWMNISNNEVCFCILQILHGLLPKHLRS